jgi:hypothetical protein
MLRPRANTTISIALNVLVALTYFVFPHVTIAQEAEYLDLQSIRALEPGQGIGALVSFKGTVTYVSGMQEFVFVQSGQEAIFVHKPKMGHATAGQTVHVRGRLANGDLLPIIADSQVDVIGRGTMPDPENVSVIGTEHDCRYLKFEFEILQSRIGVTETLLYAKTKADRDVCIEIKHSSDMESRDFANIAGRRVTLSGVLGLQIAGGAFREPGTTGNQIVGYKIFCHSTENIKIVDADKSASPASAKAVLLQR